MATLNTSNTATLQQASFFDYMRNEASWTTILIGSIVALLLGELYKAVQNAFFSPISKVPGPLVRKFTIIPHVYSLIAGKEPVTILELHQKYGPIVRFGPKHVMYAGSSEAFKDVHGARKGGYIPKDALFYGMVNNQVHSLATAPASQHPRLRRIFAPAFGDRALREQEPLIKKYSSLMSDKLHERADTGAATDMVLFYNACTFDVMAELTFGEPLGMLERATYSPWVKAIFEGVKRATQIRAFKHLGTVPNWIIDNVVFRNKYAQEKMMEHFKYSSDRVDARLAKHDLAKPDIWSLVQSEDGEDDKLTLAEQHSNGNVFMIAGTETTATLLSGVTFYVLRDPSCLDRLQSEIRAHAKSMHDLTLDGLAQLPFLNACLKEGLRLYSPVPIDLPRLVGTGGTFVEGVYLPEGTRTGICLYAAGRLEDNWKNASEFHPERWLGDPDYVGDNRDSWEPFSVGPRNCIGRGLAWHEMRVVLATVMLQFDLKLGEDCQHWDQQPIYTFWQKTPLKVYLSKAASA